MLASPQRQFVHADTYGSNSCGGLSISVEPVRLTSRAGLAGLNLTQRANMPAKITETTPTYEQAQLQLQLYEQRRETRLREARDWFSKNYFANSMEESMRIAAPGTDNGARVMMVFSYWEQACALLNYGLLHEDLFFETSGEFFAVW